MQWNLNKIILLFMKSFFNQNVTWNSYKNFWIQTQSNFWTLFFKTLSTNLTWISFKSHLVLTLLSPIQFSNDHFRTLLVKTFQTIFHVFIYDLLTPLGWQFLTLMIIKIFTRLSFLSIKYWPYPASPNPWGNHFEILLI